MGSREKSGTKTTAVGSRHVVEHPLVAVEHDFPAIRISADDVLVSIIVRLMKRIMGGQSSIQQDPSRSSVSKKDPTPKAEPPNRDGM